MRGKYDSKSRVGRSLPRKVTYTCEGCGIRKAIGQPKSKDLWAQQLQLSRVQVDMLLAAAVEFEELSEDAGTVSNAVDFVDWASVDALGGGRPSEVVEPPVLRHKEYRARGGT
jgi:hypothetical protein